MKRIQYHRYGGPEVMELQEFELPRLAKDEVRVKIRAAAVNPFDWKVRSGVMRLMVYGKFPRGVGTDFAGIVEAVGSDVAGIALGDAVVGTVPMPGGAIAEGVTTKAALIVPMPAGLTFEQAAALPAVGVTAWRALVFKSGLKAGQAVFVNGAYGGVGQAAVHIARAFGATKVAGRVGPQDIEAAETMGLNPALDYGKDIPSVLDGCFDIVFDTNGSLTLEQGNRLRRRGGVVIDTNPDAAKFMRTFVARGRKVVFGTPDQDILKKIVDLAAAGQMPIRIGRTASLDDAIGLFTDAEAGRRVRGKAIVTIA